MPIIKDYSLNYSTRVIIWKITESESKLMSGINFINSDINRMNQINSDMNRKGYIAIRRILKYLNYKSEDIKYEKNGKPFLLNENYISISHSFKMAMVGISKKKIGIDIEKKRNKILNISKKFINKNEKFALNKNDSLKFLTRIWTVKEALYKSFGKSGINFSEQIIVSPFEIEDNNGNASIICDKLIKSFSLTFVDLEDYCVTIALPN